MAEPPSGRAVEGDEAGDADFEPGDREFIGGLVVPAGHRDADSGERILDSGRRDAGRAEIELPVDAEGRRQTEGARRVQAARQEEGPVLVLDSEVAASDGIGDDIPRLSRLQRDIEIFQARFPGDEGDRQAGVRDRYALGPGQGIRGLEEDRFDIQRRLGDGLLLQAEDEAVGFDRFEGRLDAADELPEFPPGLEARQEDSHLLKGGLLAELERVGREVKGEERVVKPAEARGHPHALPEAALDDVPDERLVEQDEESRGDDDEDERAEDDARYF